MSRIRIFLSGRRPSVNLVKIGSIYLNLDRVTEIRDTGIDIEVFFSGEKATTLRGVEAEWFRQWLDSAARDLNPSA